MASSSSAPHFRIRNPAKKRLSGGVAVPDQPLRILCFGDSLTSGYPAEKPYALRLTEVVEAAFPGLKVECEVEGAPGDLVTQGHFIERMHSSWATAQHSFDWTIVLGGTNDLGWGRPADETVDALKRLWAIPLSKGSKVLALTVPETKRKYQPLIEKRDVVNDAIRNYKTENFFHFDLFKALPYHEMVPHDREKYWDLDGLHLEAAGYDLMGEKVGDALVRILRLAEAQGTDISTVTTDARQRRAIEQLAFEEEMGDPRLLSQGYIVVRRKDLD